MPIEFNNKPLDWGAEGVEPSTEKKAQGFSNGEAPAAGHWDYKFHSDFLVQTELQEKVSELSEQGIDTSTLVTKEEFTTHKADLASQESGKGASLVGINDSANQFTATTVEGALSELFTSVSNGKNQVANAITQKGQSASGSDTFAQLATAISAIDTGKKFASGTVVCSSTLLSFTVVGTSSNTNHAYVSYSGLSFKPKFLILLAVSGDYTDVVVYLDAGLDSHYIGPTVKRAQFSTGLLSGGTTYHFKADAGAAVVNGTSFLLPAQFQGSTYTFYAFS